MTTWNTHHNLKLHLESHMYKRGRFKGDAPADASRRGMSHFRVVQGNGGQMLVRMHGADLITAYEDGRIVLNTNGWHTSPTTRQCMSFALRNFTGNHGYLSSVRYGGYSQTSVHLHNKTYRYYDRMEIAADGTLLSKPISFTAKRVDREQTAEFRKDMKDCGFSDVFPILYAAATLPERTWLPYNLEKLMTRDHHANDWPLLAALAKYPTYRSRILNRPAYDDHKQALRALVASATKHMTRFVDTGETVL